MQDPKAELPIRDMHLVCSQLTLQDVNALCAATVPSSAGWRTVLP